jgi:hypothetical protein
MSFNGSGTFLINTAGQPVVAGTVISSTAFNALTADLATGLSTVITKDGQTTVTANIPMSTYKFTGLGVGSAATDSANLSQVQSTVTKLLNSVSGADTITATASPTLAAYAAGQMFYFVAAGDNTTSVTLNIDALGAKAVTRDGSTALVAADIKSGEVIVVVYDGTRFQVVSQLNSAGDARFANVSIASSLYVGGVSTFVGNAGFSANVSIASALSVGGVAAITGATTIGGNLTLSGGTASGVLYLNGSKVATSGSALVFDGTNLGIGTASPASKLHVNAASGSVFAQISSGANDLYLGYDGVSGMQTMQSDTGIFFATGASFTERMRLDTSGNLGIGTASPAAKLDVTGFARTTTGAVFQGASNLASGAGLEVGYNTGSSYSFLQSYDRTGSAYRAIRLVGSTIDFDIANSVKATIDSSGRLLVGDTTTRSVLTKTIELSSAGTSTNQGAIIVNQYVAAGNAVNTGYLTFQRSGSGTLGTNSIVASGDRLGMVRFTGANGTDYTSAAEIYAEVDGTPGASSDMPGRIIFATTGDNAGTATERARITSGGDLLVGATATVQSSRAEFTSTSLAPAFLARVNANSDEGQWAGQFQKKTNTSTTSQIFVRFLINDGATASGYITANGANAATFTSSSDARLKENIVDLPPQLSNILALKPVEFDYKDGSGHQIGFIAQDLQEVYPDCVSEGTDGMLQIGGWSKTEARLVKALQEAMARIESLEAKVTALESK